MQLGLHIHFDTVQGNFSYPSAILSKNRVKEEKITYYSIANDQVQSLRDRVFVWDFATKRYRSLHSYVPFYFNTWTPMLYKKFRDGIQKSLVFFVVSRTIMQEEGAIFTNGNATNQQLSDQMGEAVGITPALSSQDTCARIYRPGGPYGTNTSVSDIYAHVDCLKFLNWEIIEDHWFNEAEKRRVKHAEVLIPDLLPLGKVKSIVVSNQEVAQRVNEIIAESNLVHRVPFAAIHSEFFF